MRPVGPRQELRRELAADKIWMALQLPDLDKAVFLICPGNTMSLRANNSKGVVNSYNDDAVPAVFRKSSRLVPVSNRIIKPEPHRVVFLSRFCK